MVKPYSPIKAVRNQLIDRRGFIKRVAAAGTGEVQGLRSWHTSCGDPVPSGT